MHTADASARSGGPGPGADSAHDEVLTRVGQMTRSLHDNLRGLGFDKLIERAAHDIPDARDRLDYVARMTEQAAQKVLNATEAASPLQQQIESGAQQLTQQWEDCLAQPFSEQAVRAQVAQTLAYLEQVQADSAATRAHLLDIMMAQDFQDLTGQVIKKVTELAHGLEHQLVQLLLDFAPADVKRDSGAGLLNGPQIHASGSADVVSDQGQVDDLLESLGF
ncbi:MAG: protein phosphatase CheZ [Pseudomonadota bacterium]|nr:protein phosphatase CheZ [Pseudomonadota bacterium]